MLLILLAAVKSLGPVRLFAASWTVAYQAPLSMGFSRQEYWSGFGVTLYTCDLHKESQFA